MKGIHRNDGEDDVSTSTTSFPSHRHIPDDRNSHGIEDTTNGKTWGFIGLGNIGMNTQAKKKKTRAHTDHRSKKATPWP
jgi:hypothetical protein